MLKNKIKGKNCQLIELTGQTRGSGHEIGITS
jgi:hypothetical protein